MNYPSLYIALNKEDSTVSATMKVPGELADSLFENRYSVPVLSHMAMMLLDMVEQDEAAPAVLAGAAGVAQAHMLAAVKLVRELAPMLRTLAAEGEKE